MRTLAYGPLPDQVGDLYVPSPKAALPVVCLLHGGFWRMPYARDHIAPIVADLAALGFAVWNLDYRRVGQPGGGWPGTLDDVGRGIDHLATLAAAGEPLDLTDVTVVGHSAGGQLALWSAQRDALRNGGWGPRQVTVRRSVGLAPVADLARAYELGCGKGAVRDFLGGSPAEVEARYRTSSPIALVPLQAEQLLMHGTQDEIVPLELSRRHCVAADAAGDRVQLIELEGGGHFEFVDPTSQAHAALRRWLTT
jgi:acetyl esterase/lipase